MKERLHNLFIGRQGMDELSKCLFWLGLGFTALSAFLPGVLGRLLGTLSLMALMFSFIRAFSRRIEQRELENRAYLMLLGRKRADYLAWKDRFSQRKEYKFFKCPGCGRYARVPKGRGRIHINCRCGYTMYRKT